MSCPAPFGSLCTSVTFSRNNAKRAKITRRDPYGSVIFYDGGRDINIQYCKGPRRSYLCLMRKHSDSRASSASTSDGLYAARLRLGGYERARWRKPRPTPTRHNGVNSVATIARRRIQTLRTLVLVQKYIKCLHAFKSVIIHYFTGV